VTDFPLEGLKVIDAASIFAGPVAATLMGDFGADVIKVEHPRGDSLRSMGWTVEGESLFWALVSRNKRCVTLKLSTPEGRDLLKKLVSDADVFIENFRPGTLEKWGLGPDVLHDINPGLIILRTTGFGQTGPYAKRPGFGTLAEAMSGFANINGWADKPPALPPFSLGDCIAGFTGCFAIMFALWWREHGGNGQGQVIDLSIYEPLFWMLGPQALLYDKTGESVGRTGNRTPFTAPRNAYQSKDGKWLALSATAQSIAERVVRLVGRADFIDEPWFADNGGRVEHAAELDEVIGAWIADRTADEVLAEFEAAEGAIAPVYSIEDILRDPQYLARESVVRVPHEGLGDVLMQNVVAGLSATPGKVRFAGAPKGSSNGDVYRDELGLSDEEIARLAEIGVI
jgi:crotonobetainyl-CoA:carnitine CoA-transferase CaiB-like acyl-CoA transferase